MMTDLIQTASDSPLISVVMPVFKPNPAFFSKAVESILAQQLVNLELIIVEDPSSQDAARTLDLFSDSRIRHIVNPQRTSLIDQRNRGLAESRGDYIALMDGDDIAHPFRLIKQMNFLTWHPDIGLVGSNVNVIDSKDRIVGYRWFPNLHEDIQRSMTFSVPICQPSVMIRREVIEHFGGYRPNNTNIVEDYAFWSRLIKSGVCFSNIPEPLLYYRIHEDQIKQSKIHETLSDIQRIRSCYWSDEHDFRTRLQVFCERVALWMPQKLLIWLVLKKLWNLHPSRNLPPITEFDLFQQTRKGLRK